MIKNLDSKRNKEFYLFIDKRPGSLVPIFIENDLGNYRYECEAVLVEPLPSWREKEREIFISYTDNITINIIKKRWKVKVKADNPFDNGREMVRWIPEFHSRGIEKQNNEAPEFDIVEHFKEEDI